MSDYTNRLRLLEEAHHTLDKRIDGMERTGIFGDFNLEDMKKQRLLLRDQIVALKQQHQIDDKKHG